MKLKLGQLMEEDYDLCRLGHTDSQMIFLFIYFYHTIRISIRDLWTFVYYLLSRIIADLLAIFSTTV